MILALVLMAQTIEQRLDARVDPALAFRDESGRTLRLGELLGSRPLLIAPVYYRCPELCSQVLRGVASALLPLSLRPGRDFDVVAFSVDPEDTPERAAKAKAAAVARYGRADGWRFLVGDAEATRALADVLGFEYRRDPASGLYAHAAGVMVLTPDGRVARYFLGIEYPSRDLRLALVEASEGRIGRLADRISLLCLRWDPVQGRYSLAAIGLMRAGGVVTALLLAGALIRAWRRR